MKFGLFQSVQWPGPGSQEQYYKDAIEQVIYAEDLGFQSVWNTEHHFSRHGIISATHTFGAYLAAVTKRIGIGTAVTVMPFHNPVQVAEEAATVDLLSGGRLIFGVGRGYQWSEFHRFGIAMEEATERFEEAMDVVLKAWTRTEPFSHQGKFWTFNDLVVEPKPLQKPHPPVYVAAASPESVQRVVRHGWNLVLGQGESFDEVRSQMERFKSVLNSEGGSYTPDRVVLARAMYAAPSRAQAAAEARDHFMWFRNTATQVASAPEGRAREIPESFSSHRARHTAQLVPEFETAFDSVVLFGDPGYLTHRIEELRQMGIDNLILFVNYGGIEQSKVMRSLELFAKEVMPQFPDS